MSLAFALNEGKSQGHLFNSPVRRLLFECASIHSQRAVALDCSDMFSMLLKMRRPALAMLRTLLVAEQLEHTRVV